HHLMEVPSPVPSDVVWRLQRFFDSRGANLGHFDLYDATADYEGCTRALDVGRQLARHCVATGVAPKEVDDETIVEILRANPPRLTTGLAGESFSMAAWGLPTYEAVKAEQQRKYEEETRAWRARLLSPPELDADLRAVLDQLRAWKTPAELVWPDMISD